MMIEVIPLLAVVLLLLYFVYRYWSLVRFRRLLLEALVRRDVDLVYGLVRGRPGLARRVGAAVLGEVFNFLFFRGEFEKFVELTRVVGVDDPRARILDLDVDVVALDVETEVVFERRPREIGFVAIRSRDWSVAFRLRVSDFKALVDKYGVEPRNFLRKFLGRFRVVVGHNVFLHDLEVLRGWGVDLCVPLIDTYLLSLLVVPEARFHSLEYLSDVFGVDYTPHVADEDAYASAMILPYLVGIAKSKGLLDAIVSVDYYPLVGLKVINVPSREFVFRRSRFKCSSSFEVAVVFDAYDCVDAWYPLVVSREKLAALGSSLYSMSDRLALIIVESYLRGGGRSVDELRELYIPYRSIADSLRDILDRVCVENPLPDLRSGFSVEYRHLYDLISRWRIGGGKAGRIRFVGAYLLKVYCGGRLGEVLSWAKDNFNEVVFHTVFPQDFDLYDVLIEAPEKPPRVLRVVEEGLDKSSRHFRYLGRILASIVSEGCSLVVVANRAEEFIARDAAFKVKGKAIVLNVGGSKALKVLRYMRRFAGWRYSVVLYSLRTLRARLASTRRLEEFLKMLIEASYYGGIGLTVLNAKYGILSSVGLHDYVDHITVMPRDDVDVELSYVVFDSLDDALRRVEEVVAEKWGFRLRPYQRRCVARLLLPYCREGSRVNMPLTIVLLPTGSGKSLIFQSVARVLRRRIGGTTVVVSPLLALIEDQVYSLRRRGIRVCRITGLVDSSMRSRLIRGLARGEYDLVYITPEQFQKEIVRRSFEKADINYVILDEIHTLSKWGRSFRPSYMYLAEYPRKRRSEGFWIPIAGFTATLPSSELEAVLKFLSGAEGFDIDEIDFSTDYDRSVAEMRFQVKVIKGPVLRDNITINVMAAPAGESKLRYLAKVVRDLIDWSEEVSGGRPWIGIVYTGFVRSTREYENVETIAEYLSQVLNEKVGYFHGQLDRREKKRILDSLYMVSRGVIRYPRIIVATKAFGMGVDIPNIRWIVHYIMPETVEDYYQEIGRGGRDGELCRAVMLFSPGYDFRRRYTLLKRGFIDPRVVFVIHEFLARYAGTDARIPLVILCLLVHNFMYGNTWKYVAYGRTLPERVDTCVRKSLNLMARLGILDYDIIYDRFVVTDDEVSAGVRIAKIGNKDLYLATLKDVKHDGSLYDAYVVGLYGGYDALVKFIPEGLPGNLRLLIKPAGGNGEELGLRITGAKEAVLINYLVPQINRRDAYDLVRREQFYEMVALFYMNNYAETVVSKPADERDKVARMLIKEYLSRSIKDLYREFISEKKMKLAYVDTEVFRMYNTLIKKGRLNLWVRYRDKKMLAEFMAYLTLIHFLEKEYPPNSIAVVLPYGYRSSFVESFRELYGMLGMPLIEPETVIVKRSDIYRLKDIVLDLSRMPQVFILASNYTLKRLAYDLENSSGSGVYTVCVKR